MCGIAGIIRRGGRAPDDSATAPRMLDHQRHRGPDGQGLSEDARSVLGHRRLAIIDLSEAGHQPMSTADGSLQVTFNGEIYNYRELRSELIARGYGFRSQTDTEVLLHGYEEWGPAGLLERMRGMFAFALREARADRPHRLILARDRLGIKPLYYFGGDGFLCFASEVKALVRSGLVPDERDPNALAGFLIGGTIPQPLTAVKGVRCLPPGHWAEVEDGRLAIHKYWDLEWPPGKSADDGDPAGLGGLLEGVVRRHLIGDVPLGVFLSGGVDSGGLVALSSRIRRQQGLPLRTLTVAFDDQQYDEANPASELAKRFETAHTEIRVTSGDFRKALPEFLAAMDQPTNDGINTYFVSRAAKDAGLTVVLSGLGGDEVFWGYKHYRWLRNLGWTRHCPGSMWPVLAGAGSVWGRWRGKDNWKRTAWLNRGISGGSAYLTLRGFFAPDAVGRLLDMNRTEVDGAAQQYFGAGSFPGAGRDATSAGFNYIEMKRYLHDQLLRDTDVFSMAHSIEARVPYLDHEVVERLWRTPPDLKFDRTVNKPLLVGAIDDAGVQQAGSRPKRGFTFPMTAWMKECANDLQDMAEAGPLPRKAVRSCWEDFRAGRMHWSRAWALTVLGARN